MTIGAHTFAQETLGKGKQAERRLRPVKSSREWLIAPIQEAQNDSFEVTDEERST